MIKDIFPILHYCDRMLGVQRRSAGSNRDTNTGNREEVRENIPLGNH